jgi:hypothetical protein
MISRFLPARQPKFEIAHSGTLGSFATRLPELLQAAIAYSGALVERHPALKATKTCTGFDSAVLTMSSL